LGSDCIRYSDQGRITTIGWVVLTRDKPETNTLLPGGGPHQVGLTISKIKHYSLQSSLSQVFCYKPMFLCSYVPQGSSSWTQTAQLTLAWGSYQGLYPKVKSLPPVCLWKGSLAPPSRPVCMCVRVCTCMCTCTHKYFLLPCSETLDFRVEYFSKF
jgi:hypothetical protein